MFDFCLLYLLYCVGVQKRFSWVSDQSNGVLVVVQVVVVFRFHWLENYRSDRSPRSISALQSVLFFLVERQVLYLVLELLLIRPFCLSYRCLSARTVPPCAAAHNFSK